MSYAPFRGTVMRGRGGPGREGEGQLGGVKGGGAGAGRRRGQSRGQGGELLKWRETGGLGRQDRSSEEGGIEGQRTGETGTGGARKQAFERAEVKMKGKEEIARKGGKVG